MGGPEFVSQSRRLTICILSFELGVMDILILFTYAQYVFSQIHTQFFLFHTLVLFNQEIMLHL